MPRKPTGRPTGRPPGNGKLGAQTRLSIRIPQILYDRLEAYAEGRSHTRRTPQLADCVRQALEHFLTCPHKRQTENIPVPVRYTKSMPESETPSHEDTLQQTVIVPRILSGETVPYNGQTESIPATVRDTQSMPESETLPHEDISQQTISTPSGLSPEIESLPVAPVEPDQAAQSAPSAYDYDQEKYVLGNLCNHGHDYHGTGQSLRHLKGAVCLACDAARAKAYRQRKAATVAEGAKKVRV